MLFPSRTKPLPTGMTWLRLANDSRPHGNHASSPGEYGVFPGRMTVLPSREAIRCARERGAVPTPKPSRSRANDASSLREFAIMHEGRRPLRLEDDAPSALESTLMPPRMQALRTGECAAFPMERRFIPERMRPDSSACPPSSAPPSLASARPTPRHPRAHPAWPTTATATLHRRASRLRGRSPARGATSSARTPRRTSFFASCATASSSTHLNRSSTRSCRTRTSHAWRPTRIPPRSTTHARGWPPSP